MPFPHNLSTPERASKNVHADVGVKRSRTTISRVVVAAVVASHDVLLMTVGGPRGERHLCLRFDAVWPGQCIRHSQTTDAAFLAL